MIHITVFSPQTQTASVMIDRQTCMLWETLLFQQGFDFLTTLYSIKVHQPHWSSTCCKRVQTIIFHFCCTWGANNSAVRHHKHTNAFTLWFFPLKLVSLAFTGDHCKSAWNVKAMLKYLFSDWNLSYCTWNVKCKWYATNLPCIMC